MSSLPPFLIMLAGAGTVALAPALVARWVVIAAPAIVLAQLLWFLDPGASVSVGWLDLELTLLRVGPFNEVFATVFALLGILGGVYGLEVMDRRQQVAALAYGASAMGVVFAGDLVTVIIFWELMAVTSTALVMSGGRAQSRRAGVRYLFVHVVGGSLLLTGILWHIAETGSTAFGHLDESVGAWLMLGGVAVNAAVVPLQAWLPDAYPEASPAGMVFLSGLTTKTAVFVLIRAFEGWGILVPFGVLMAVYAMVMAVLEDDIRRLLAYHIISQVGFMVAAVGIGGELGLGVAAGHAFAHVIYKGLLVMAAGAVLHATGRSRLSELGGLAANARLLLVFYMIGALTISAFPFFAGFATKGLVAGAVYDAGQRWMAFWLWVASVGTFISTGLKVPYYAWFSERRTALVRSVPAPMYLAMGGAALLSIAIGLSPGPLYDALYFAIHPEPYELAKVVHTIELLVFTAIAFWVLKHHLDVSPSITLDMDWFYRKAHGPVRVLVQQPLESVFTAAERATTWVTATASRLVTTPESGWAAVLSRWRRAPEATVSLLGRPPLGVAVAGIVVTFAVIVALAELR